MFYLVLTVLCSALLGFLFKLFPRFQVDGFQAIVFNYCTCVVCGWIHLGRFPVAAEGWSAGWVPYALGLGFIFISGFNCAALTVRFFGVTISQIMQKMSILITVPFAILVYHESSGLVKIAGFVLALAAIVLVNWPSEHGINGPKIQKRSLWWLPFLTWLLAGILESVLVLVQQEGLIDPSNPSFISTIFATAATIGLIISMIGWISGRMRFSWRNIAGGVLLGIPNYGSILFMLLALDSNLEGSFVFPAANVSIIILTTIGAVALFQERLSRINWAGIALAVGAIAFISM